MVMQSNPEVKVARDTAIRAALSELDKLNSKERKERLEKVFIESATARKPDDQSFIPLFERAGVRDSEKLQKEIIRLGAEYIDMFLTQLLMQMNLSKVELERWALSEKVPVDKKADAIVMTRLAADERRSDYLENLTQKELLVWRDHSLASLSQYEKEVRAYTSALFAKNDFNVNNVDTTFCATRMLGSIINVSMRTAMEKLVGKIPSEYDLELIHDAKLDWAYGEAFVYRSGTEKGPAVGTPERSTLILELLALQVPTTPGRGG